MQRILLVGSTALVLLTVGVTRHSGLESRLATVEEAALRQFGDRATGAVHDLEREVAALRSELAAADQRSTNALDLEQKVSDLEAKLTTARAQLSTQATELDEVRVLAAAVDRIDEVEAGVNVRWDGLVQTLDATTTLAQETKAQLGQVQTAMSVTGPAAQPVASDDAQWRAMVAPTVQLAGDATVGSGVVLASQPIAGTSPVEHRTLLLTSWHVVRDIRADAKEGDAPVPVTFRGMDGTKRSMTATLLSHDVPLDAALLQLNTTERFDIGAKLPTRERLRSLRVFHPIVAVGCPLGNDPIPTRGHLSDLHHEVGGERFWMISAPTYIGNSGGGLYSGTGHELIGIFSKIYTHGAIRPTVIPHMGLVTPLEEFYTWIDKSQVAQVIERDGAAEIVVR